MPVFIDIDKVENDWCFLACNFNTNCCVCSTLVSCMGYWENLKSATLHLVACV